MLSDSEIRQMEWEYGLLQALHQSTNHKIIGSFSLTAISQQACPDQNEEAEGLTLTKDLNI